MTQIITGRLGEHVSESAKRAIIEAEKFQAEVILDFNDIRIPVGPTSDPLAIVALFSEAVEARRKAWEASPEGQANAKRQAEHEAAVKEREMRGAVHIEAEMAKMTPPRFSSIEELAAYIQSRIDGKHDYGTCVYAMSLAAQAAFDYVAGQLGVTGFQASCADLHFISKTRRIEGPFMLLKAQDMLYPQYNLHDMLSKAMDEWREWCAEEAKKKLAEKGEGSVHPNVEHHWRTLAAYIAPKKEE